jgi:CubicO group peptidase (beta-lactamase class C family)
MDVRHFRFVALALSLGCAAPNATVPTLRPNRRMQSLRDILHRATEERVTGGAVALVATDGKVVFLESAGTIGGGAPMPVDAIVRLASITKPMTAVATLMLLEEGRLHLDDRVEEWFPGFGRAVSADGGTVATSRPITILDLLTHRAGLATEGAGYDRLFDAASAAEYARGIGALPLRFQPGTRFEYGCCGSAYEVLGAVIEKVSAQPYDRFVAARITGPLGMRDTTFRVPDGKRERLAAQFCKDASGELVECRRRGEEQAPTRFFSGAGGLRSTASDYARFAQFLLNGGELDGIRLLRAESVRAMMTNQVGDQYRSSGYGWGYGGQVKTGITSSPEAIGSYGWAGGTGTQFLIDPSRRVVVVAFMPTNPGTPRIEETMAAIIKAAIEASGR